MKAANIRKHRLTGFTIGPFGVSWTTTESARDVARSVIAFLEDRRVLYVPGEMEVPEYCVQSVLAIRAYLTLELQRPSADKELGEHLRGMRAACRKFLDTVQADEREASRFANYRGHWASWTFYGAVGELRASVGVHLAQIAARYDLDVEDDLAAILPAADEDVSRLTSHGDNSSRT